MFDQGAIGSVTVAMWVNERGSVEWAAVQQSSGLTVLDQIALDAFNDIVTFSPARAEGAAVPVSVVISVPFNVPW
jgi:TonB family protein